MYTFSDKILEKPRTVEKALNSPNHAEWKKAMDDEILSHTKNGSWTLEKLPRGRKAIDCRWVFKIKYNADGSIEHYKAQLVAKGYSLVVHLVN